MKTCRVGVVGAGYFSELHLDAWSRHPNVEVVGLCDLDREKREEKARRFGLSESALFPSLEAMLKGAAPDVVDIVTRPETHRDLVETATAGGAAILCQKPFAPAYEDAEAMARRAESAGVRLMVTENWRWLDPYQAVKRALDEGRIGKIRSVRFVHRSYTTPLMAPGVWLKQPYFREMPRLLFYEMGVHWYDTWRFLFGDPMQLHAELGRISPYVVGEDIGVVLLRHEGFTGVLDASWAAREELDRFIGREDLRAGVEWMTVEGEAGTLKLSPSGKTVPGCLTLIEDDRVTPLADGLRFDNVDALDRLQVRFLRCLETGEPFPTGAEDNLKTLEMVFATYESARTGGWIDLGGRG